MKLVNRMKGKYFKQLTIGKEEYFLFTKPNVHQISEEACKIHNYEIERICFCDVDAESLACNYKNCLLNEKNCENVDWMELRESDLWGGFCLWSIEYGSE